MTAQVLQLAQDAAKPALVCVLTGALAGIVLYQSGHELHPAELEGIKVAILTALGFLGTNGAVAGVRSSTAKAQARLAGGSGGGGG